MVGKITVKEETDHLFSPVSVFSCILMVCCSLWDCDCNTVILRAHPHQPSILFSARCLPPSHWWCVVSLLASQYQPAPHGTAGPSTHSTSLQLWLERSCSWALCAVLWRENKRSTVFDAVRCTSIYWLCSKWGGFLFAGSNFSFDVWRFPSNSNEALNPRISLLIGWNVHFWLSCLH